MKFEEVLAALKEGRKIRRKKWDKDCYYRMIYKDDKNVIVNNCGEVVVDWEDIFADDWENVKEKKKIKLRDLTKEQFIAYCAKHLQKNKRKCGNCIFKNIICVEWHDSCWINHKELYSDKFLDQEIEIED